MIFVLSLALLMVASGCAWCAASVIDEDPNTGIGMIFSVCVCVGVFCICVQFARGCEEYEKEKQRKKALGVWKESYGCLWSGIVMFGLGVAFLATNFLATGSP